jgi:predicted amidophosphoribosyltransferase
VYDRAALLLHSLLVPPRCGACGAGTEAGRPLCFACDAALVRMPPLVSDPGPPGVGIALAAGAYDGVARTLVAALKFGRRLPLAERAADAIETAARPHGLLGAPLVPVPPDPLRIRARGFDPAEEIAAALSRRTGLPLERCLERRAAPRQVGRRREDRVAEPPRISAWRTPPGATVLIDDVWTTGATLSAAAAALRQAGTQRVVAVTLAHAL